MQSEQDLWRSDEEDCPKRSLAKDFTCDTCGKTFQKPILATISTGDQTQTYYACPRCLVKVQTFKAESKKNDEEPPILSEERGKRQTEPESPVKCEHFFGYLNKHQKNTPFPEDCLTCPKMVECMRH